MVLSIKIRLFTKKNKKYNTKCNVSFNCFKVLVKYKNNYIANAPLL